jgi:hypothetical protein
MRRLPPTEKTRQEIARLLREGVGDEGDVKSKSAHRWLIRTTNLLERLFLEERRRLNASHTMFGERAVLKLMDASIVRAADRWRGITISDFERRQLEKLQEQILSNHRRATSPAAPATQIPFHVSSKDRT